MLANGQYKELTTTKSESIGFVIDPLFFSY